MAYLKKSLRSRELPLESAKEAAMRSTALLKGWSEKRWTPRKGQPFSYLHDGVWEWESYLCLDHQYRLVRPGREVFVSEPYGLDPNDIEALNELATQGWEVSIHPERAVHFPGRTVAIWMER